MSRPRPFAVDQGTYGIFEMFTNYYEIMRCDYILTQLHGRQQYDISQFRAVIFNNTAFICAPLFAAAAAAEVII